MRNLTDESGLFDSQAFCHEGLEVTAHVVVGDDLALRGMRTLAVVAGVKGHYPPIRGFSDLTTWKRSVYVLIPLH